jgi:hypothetical protein
MINCFRASLASMMLLLLSATAFPQSMSHMSQQPETIFQVVNLEASMFGSNADDPPVSITSGKIQITAPAGWKTAEDLNDQADLQATDVKNQMYLIVLTDNKVDYTDMTLDKHSKETLEVLLKPLASVTKTGPTTLRVNNDPAVQYEVRGTIIGLNVVYVHTTVETRAHFQQIVTWMTVSTYESKKDVIQTIIRSFREIGK